MAAAEATRASVAQQAPFTSSTRTSSSAAWAATSNGAGGAASVQVAAPGAAAASGGQGALGAPGAGQPADGGGAATGSRKAGGAQPDADGFVVVANRRGTGQRNAAAGMAAARAPADPGAHDMQVDEDAHDVTEAAVVQGPQVHAAGDAAAARVGRDLEGEGDGEDGDDDGTEETPADLKRKLDEETAMVRWLEREGVAQDHPSMRAALAAREAAERSWRESRAPQPVGKRMGWAQARLDRALRQQDRVVRELAIFDSEVKAQRDKIGERLLAARAKVSKQREALEELQEEAASLVRSPASQGRGRQVCTRVVDGIAATVAPGLVSLAASIPAGTAAASKLAELMGHIEGIQMQLRSVVDDSSTQGDDTQPESRPSHQIFNIGDGGASEAWSESHELDGGTTTGADGTKEGDHKAQGPQAEAQWQTRGHGRWCRGPETGMDPGVVGKPGGEAGTAHEVSTGHGMAPTSPSRAATRGRALDSSSGGVSTDGCGRQGGMAEDGGAEPPAAKSRKGQAAGDSEDAVASVQHTRRAVEWMAQQAAAASAAADSTDAMAAAQQAAQAHASVLAAITSKAIAQGVQPITAEGHDLVMPDMDALARWADENLRPEAGW